MITNILTGLLGLSFYIVWNAREYIMDGSFSFTKGFKENWKRMTWVMVMIVMLSIIYQVLPEAFTQMSGVDGLTIPNTVEKGTFFGISIALSKYVKLLIKKQVV